MARLSTLSRRWLPLQLVNKSSGRIGNQLQKSMRSFACNELMELEAAKEFLALSVHINRMLSDFATKKTISAAIGALTLSLVMGLLLKCIAFKVIYVYFQSLTNYYSVLRLLFSPSLFAQRLSLCCCSCFFLLLRLFFTI